jgi:hypothetical protein
MKHTILLILLLPLTIYQCGANGESNECEDNVINSMQCIVAFQMDNDVSHLDTALFYINEGFEKCEKYKFLFAIRKIGVYIDKHDFPSAITFTDSLDSQLFYLPYYKNLLSHRCKAMEAQEKGDTLNRNAHIKNIVSETTVFMSQHREELDTLMQSKSILQSGYSFAPIQFYYYRSLLEKPDKIKLEIDSLQQAINGNEEYFEMMRGFLNEDFMYFGGF